MQSRESIRIAGVDKFLFLRLNESQHTLPVGRVLDNLVGTLHSLCASRTIICDARGVGEATNDINECLWALSEIGGQVLVRRGQSVRAAGLDVPPSMSVVIAEERRLPLTLNHVPLSAFEDGADISERERERLWSKAGTSVLSDDEWAIYLAEWARLGRTDIETNYSNERILTDAVGVPGAYDEVLRHRLLTTAIKRSARGLGMRAVSLELAEGRIRLRPWHSHAAFMCSVGSHALPGIPAIQARRASGPFERALAELDELMSDGSAKERHFQGFLERNEWVFGRLGYQEVRAQVVLERDQGPGERPDFMVRPIGREWWDIIDLKLPNVPLLSSSTHHMRPSKHLVQLAAQLREYGDYFSDEVYARRVEERYGISCYKPKLIGIIGRSPTVSDQRQVRRVLTAYDDLEILTFDDLRRVAESRLLI